MEEEDNSNACIVGNTPMADKEKVDDMGIQSQHRDNSTKKKKQWPKRISIQQ
jgi:hypothetical protein